MGALPAAGDDEGKAFMIDPSAALRNVVQRLPGRTAAVLAVRVLAVAHQGHLEACRLRARAALHVGGYRDPEAAAQAPGAGLDDTLRAAFEAYAANACYPHPDGRSEAPDGEPVTIWDQDAGL